MNPARPVAAGAWERLRRTSLLFLVCGALSPATALTEAAQTTPAGTFDSRILLSAEGQAMAFAGTEDLLSFLATAEERSVTNLSRGITGAKRLTLGQEGVEARVVFHHIDRSEPGPRRLSNGRTVMYLRDSYKSQVAAYRLGRLLGLQNIPPTVVRVSGATTGSAQLWIEEAVTEDIRLREGPDLPDHNLWNQTVADMWVFDNLINNIDRNQGNMLVDSFGSLWLIDHTRSFGQDRALPLPEMITRCSNRMLQALRSLDEETVKNELEPYLTRAQLGALWHRRERVLARIDEAVAVRGAHQVLFDYRDPDPGVSIREE